jgi:glycosyltransferase involved in cell wall biosynthesis
MSEDLISIVLPVHNQADHIKEVIEDYENMLKEVGHPYELILVLNACRDNSYEIVKILANKLKSVRIVQSNKGGWGRAVRLGLKEAKGKILCYTNCARTTADELKSMLGYGIRNPDVVIKANRKNRNSGTRQIGSILYNLEVRFLFNLYTWDINGTPKVFSRKFEKLLSMTRDDDLIDAEFNIICHRAGYALLEAPIFSSKRYGGKSTTNILTAIKMYYGIYKLWKKNKVAS